MQFGLVQLDEYTVPALKRVREALDSASQQVRVQALELAKLIYLLVGDKQARTRRCVSPRAVDSALCSARCFYRNHSEHPPSVGRHGGRVWPSQQEMVLQPCVPCRQCDAHHAAAIKASNRTPGSRQPDFDVTQMK